MTTRAERTSGDCLVSVVIATHNRADYVGAAIESVLSQTEYPVEVIVIDDASTDATPAVLEAFGDRIRVSRSERNEERGAARNAGARLARGKVLAFLDSDDEWNPGKLAEQVPIAGRGRASVTGISFIDEQGRDLGRTYEPPADAHRQIRLFNPYLGAPSSMVLPRALFHETEGFPEVRDVQGSEDWVFLVQLIDAAGPPVTVPSPLVRYRVHDLNSTADPAAIQRSIPAAIDWLEARGYISGRTLRGARARAALAIGRAFAAKRDWRAAGSWAVRAGRDGTPVEAARAIGMIARTSVGSLMPRRPQG